MTAARLTSPSLAVLVFSLACAQPMPHGASELRQDAIVGGIPTQGDPDVFMLTIHGDNGTDALCTATLIAPRTLLTAAHCVDPSMMGAVSLSIIATNAATASDVQPGINTVAVGETRTHPRWNPAANLEADIALALLEIPQAISPRLWNSTTMAGMGGQPVRAVGYGSVGLDAGSGIKRTVDLSIRQLSTHLITLGNLADKGICHGDSGGPTFHTFADQLERLVGVHSFTRSEDCLDGADTRVDAYAPFLLEWLAEKEDACGANLVCATGPCAAADPDCVALGKACATAFECQGRQCITDAQHLEPYCSTPCTFDGECGPDLRCDVTRALCQRRQLPVAQPGESCVPEATSCANGSVCSSISDQPARCALPCRYEHECPEHQGCQLGSLGQRVCGPLAPTQVPLAQVSGPAAAGCSVGSELWPALALLTARFLRGRQGDSRYERAARGASNC